MKKIMSTDCIWQMILLILIIGSLSTQRVQAQCSGVTVSDSLELVAFYNATNGDNWDDNSGWLVDPVEQWHGITLSSDGCHVAEIILVGNNLKGRLIDLQLPNLTNLTLFRNELSDAIPNFSNLLNLTLLALTNNKFSGSVPDFNNFPNLNRLLLYSNNLSGVIPDFKNLPNLTELDLSHNYLSGIVPDFSNLSNSKKIFLTNNAFSGGVPDFSNLPNLEQLAIGVNNLTGEIPDFSSLPNLTKLYLNHNDLSGEIPDFNNVPNLISLLLDYNDLSGEIPDFNNLPNLTELLLNHNDLIGLIPDFSNLPELDKLFLDYNSLIGVIPDFSNMPNLTEFRLKGNNIIGTIPNFSNIPKLESFNICPNNLYGGIPDFVFCPLLNVQAIDFSCAESAQVSGYVFYDANANCIKEENEKGIPNVSVYTVDQQFITTTDETGFYVLKPYTGTYTFASYWSNNNWTQTCPESSSPHTTTIANLRDNISDLNFAYEPNIECPQMQVEIGSPVLTRCFSNTYTVNYCNMGAVPAENASIELFFPDELIPLSSSIPYVQADDRLIFDLGEVGLLECGSFTIKDSISCEATLGSTACVEAYIYPDDPCEVDPSWEGEDMDVQGKCVGDSVQFIIKNTGSDMRWPSVYKMYENDILMATDTFQLESGESFTISHEAIGATYRLSVYLSVAHPSRTMITEVIEGCGDAPFTFGLVNSQWDGDESPLFDFDCQEIVGSYDPNDKTVFPSGVLEGNHIPDSIDLTYRIRFQNTGNAVAYRVIIIDTIDIEHLQLSTLELGAYSHEFELEVKDGNILIFTFNDILLPDSTSNEPASHGFITYTLAQKEENKIDDLITNEAAIYFDYNQPVITNKVFNTVGIPDTTTVDFIYISVTPPTIIADNLWANVNYANEQLFIQMNQVQTGEQFSLQLFNISGQEIGFIPKISVPLHQEQLSEVKAGVYIYYIESSKGRVAKGKVLMR